MTDQTKTEAEAEVPPPPPQLKLVDAEGNEAKIDLDSGGYETVLGHMDSAVYVVLPIHIDGTLVFDVGVTITMPSGQTPPYQLEVSAVETSRNDPA